LVEVRAGGGGRIFFFYMRAQVSRVNDGPRIIYVRVVYRLQAAW